MYILMGVQILFGVACFATNFAAVQQFRDNLDSFLPMGAVSFIQLALAAASAWYAVGKLGFGENPYRRAFVCAFLLTVPFLLQMHMARLVWSLSLSTFLWFLGLLLEIRKSGLSGRRAALLLVSFFFYGIICPDGLWLGGILLITGLWTAGRAGRDGKQRTGEQGTRETEAEEQGTREEKPEAEAQETAEEPWVQRMGTEKPDGRKAEAAEGYGQSAEAAEPGGREIKRRRKRLKTEACFAAAAVLTAGLICLVNAGLNKGFPEQRTIYRENSFGTAVLSRFVWPYFGKHYYFWNEDVKAILSEEEAAWIGLREDLVGEEFYPLLEETYGKKKAIKLCIGMGRSCLEIRTKEVVGEMGRDFKDYLLLPFTIERNLRGEGTSLTGWNYGRMREQTPILVKYYYRYSLLLLPVLLLGSFLLLHFEKNGRTLQLMRERAESGKERQGLRKEEDRDSSVQRENSAEWEMPAQRIIPTQWGYMVFVLGLYALWYTMRSNIPIDYKAGLPILFIWYLASVSGLLCGEKGRQT